MSERGPKGDHGQHGDIGPTGVEGPEGAAGVQGITGERGKMGDPGVAGKRGLRGPAFAGPIAWVVLVIVVTAALIGQGCQIRKNTETTNALCDIRANLEHRIARTDAILNSKEFEGMDEIFGIPRDLIVAGRNEDQQTVDALNEIDCA